MISVRFKDFLVNLLIASILAAILFGGFFFRKQIVSFISLGKDRILELTGSKTRDFTSKRKGINVKGKVGERDFNTAQGILESIDGNVFTLNLDDKKGEVIYEGDVQEGQARLIIEEGGVEMIEMGEIQKGDYLVFLNVTSGKQAQDKLRSR